MIYNSYVTDKYNVFKKSKITIPYLKNEYKNKVK